MKKITHEMLVVKGACRNQRLVFQKNFPDGMEVNVENLFLLASLSFVLTIYEPRTLSLYWLTCFLSREVAHFYSMGGSTYFRPDVLYSLDCIPDEYNEDLTLLAHLLMEAPEPV